jgi:hypothetical protein
MSFQWLSPSAEKLVDWESPLPDVEWPDDGELVP